MSLFLLWLGEKNNQAHPRRQSNGLVLSSGGLIKGGGLGNFSVIGPSVNTYLADVSSKWPSTAFRASQSFRGVILHVVFLHRIFFFPFYLHKLFYDEGADAEGIEVGGKVKISQDPAGGTFGAQREPGLTFLSTEWGGGERGGLKLSETKRPVADKHQLC